MKCMTVLPFAYTSYPFYLNIHFHQCASLCSVGAISAKVRLLSFPRLAPVFKTIFHQCVISYTCSQYNSDGYIRVILASSICYDTLIKFVLKTGTSLIIPDHLFILSMFTC